MKIFLILLIVFIIGDIATALKKSHHGRSHQHSHSTAPPTHQDSSTGHKNETKTFPNTTERRDQHLKSGENESKNSAPARNTPTTPSTQMQGTSTPKKNLLQTKAEEHNVRDKKIDDQAGIQMETEYLIDVTPKPTSSKKTTPGHKRRTQNTTEKGKQRKALREFGQSSGIKSSHRSKPRKTKDSVATSTKNVKKGRKYPKKYNAQKHNPKKNSRQKDKKTGDKKREKREKLKEKRDNKKKNRNQDKKI